MSDEDTSSSEMGAPFTRTQLLASTVGSGVVDEATVDVLRLLPLIVINPPEATPETPSAELVTLEITGCGSGASYCTASSVSPDCDRLTNELWKGKTAKLRVKLFRIALGSGSRGASTVSVGR